MQEFTLLTIIVVLFTLWVSGMPFTAVTEFLKRLLRTGMAKYPFLNIVDDKAFILSVLVVVLGVWYFKMDVTGLIPTLATLFPAPEMAVDPLTGEAVAEISKLPPSLLITIGVAVLMSKFNFKLFLKKK